MAAEPVPHGQLEPAKSSPPSQFAFVTCQVGAEAACKRELARSQPQWKLAFSRPGFLTFKRGTTAHAASELLTSTFARTWGWSLERLSGTDGNRLAERAAQVAAGWQITAIHVWQRETCLPGDHNYEPFQTPLAQDVGHWIARSAARRGGGKLRVNRQAKPGELVMDVILIEPHEWWLGWHRVQTIFQRWPGGVPPQVKPTPVVSRAYFKMAELLLWGRIPLRSGDICLELGSAPGGATQRLLELGAKVISVDPAVLDESVAAHPQVTHLRMRSREMPRAKMAGVRWLFADLNVAPRYTLAAVEDLVTHRRAHCSGLGLTLKLTNWELADQLDDYRQRVKSWGFDVVKSRQLAFNRQEVCLVALRDKFQMRLGRLQKRSRLSRAAKAPDS